MRRCGKDQRAGAVASRELRSRRGTGFRGTVRQCLSGLLPGLFRRPLRRPKAGCLFDPLPI